MQIGFGMDFSQDPYVQSLAGDNGLPSLLMHTHEGIMKAIRNPFLHVSLLHYMYIHCLFCATVLCMMYSMYCIISKHEWEF